jgi:cysteine desulfuration protein SufE
MLESALDPLDQLKADFELLDEWEDRYRHVIDLGKSLAPLPDHYRTPAYKVRGCASQVWIVSTPAGGGGNPVLTFTGDSDALIVKGLIAIAFMIYDGKTAKDIVAIDAVPILNELGLSGHLTQQRSNGFASMIERMKSDARAALQGSA